MSNSGSVNEHQSERDYGRQLTDHISFVGECIELPPIEDTERETLADWHSPGDELHLSQIAYIIQDTANLMFDTLSPLSGDTVVEAVDAVLDGEDLDYLVVSHPEANHAGNAWNILEAYPEATLVAPARGTRHEMFDIGAETRLVEHGDVIDLGSHSVEFLEPLFYDHVMTTYMWERSTDTLFTVDFLGFEHVAGECQQFVDEFETEVTPGRLQRFNSMAFVWMRYVDPEATDHAIDQLIDNIDPEILAPAHGQPIRADAREHLERAKTAINRVSGIESSQYHKHTQKHRMLREDMAQ